MTIVIQRIIRQFHFAEEQSLGLPVFSRGWTLRMQIHALRALGLGSSGRHPLGSRELIATIANGHHLEEHAIAGLLLQSTEGNPHRREHASERDGGVG